MAKILIDPADIIAGSWRNFVKHWKLYAEFTVWIVLLSLLVWIFGVLTRSLIADRILASGVFGAISLPVTIVFGLVIASVIDATAKTLRNSPADARSSLAVGAHKLLPFIWVSILVALMVGLGFVLLVVPALIFAVWYAFASNHLIVDDVHGTAALAKSKALVVGRWWSVLFRIFVPWLVFFFTVRFGQALTYLLLGAVLGDPGRFFGAISDIYTVPTLHLLVTTVVPQIFYGLSLPLFLGANLILWFDLKRPDQPAAAK